MLQNVINSIIEAEEKADIIVKEASQQAKDNYLSVKADSEKMLKDNQLALKAEVRSVYADAEKQANEKYDAIIKDGQIKADKLLDESSEKITEASEFICGRLLEKYGNS